MKKKSSRKTASKKAPSGAAPNATMEQAMRALQNAMGEMEFASMDDLNALMTSLTGPLAGDSLPNEEYCAKAEAQVLALDAMEAESEAQARKQAKRALAKDPDCVDALVLLTSLDARSAKAAIEGMQKAVAAGERSLGPDFIRENKGHFWMLLDTRPYMRALSELAMLLGSEGIYLDAITVYEKMLELNPQDNQCVRDPLLGLYLTVADLKGAARLLKKFKEDASANFEWGRVLERFLADDMAGAEAALREARQSNPYVELYLSGQKPLPKASPQMYSPGSEEEAILCLEQMMTPWSLHKKALFWLLAHLITE